MEELMLMGGLLNAPSFLPDAAIAACTTYREAVRVSWGNRRIKAMTMRTLAERTDSYPSHVSDYLHADDKPSRRDLPAGKVTVFCAVVGNWGVQQWLARQAKLTLMEEVIARRAA